MEEKYRAEQLEPLSDGHLSDIAAMVVMGWSVDVESKIRRYLRPDGQPNGVALDWEFAKDLDAAFALVAEICKWELMFRLECLHPDWTAEFQTDQDNRGHFRQFAVHTSPNRTRAIAIACILAGQKLSHVD